MNILQTKKHIDKLYKKIFKIIKNEFLAVANSIYQEVGDEAIEMDFDGDLGNIDETWVEEFFKEYSPVTKYVFRNELERKFSRLFEALIADLEERLNSYETAEKQIVKQIKQMTNNRFFIIIIYIITMTSNGFINHFKTKEFFLNSVLNLI